MNNPTSVNLLPSDMSTSKFPISSDSLRTALGASYAEEPRTPLISDKTRIIAQWVSYGVLLFVISSFGIVTNIMNIMCFVKQGLKDPVNTSLLGLAISDFGCLITSLGISICFNPAVYGSDIGVNTEHIGYTVVGWPHVIFIRLTSWITALITLERCVCMILPLKVNTIVTSRRVAAFIICLFFIISACVAPEFYVNRLVVKFVPERNRTMLALDYTQDKVTIQKISFTLNFIVMPFSAYITIIIGTIILVITLRKKAKWRETSTVKADDIFKRDQRVTKMVVAISVLFIACFSPLCITFIGVIFEPELAVGGLYFRTLYVLVGFSIVLGCTNSATNIFIYYHMSSRYKTMFQRLFLGH